MNDVDVAIVGAGPTGLALAGELALAGVSCAVYERRAAEPNLTRAFAVHARTLELLDARGLADRLLPRGLRVQSVSPAPGASLDLGILPGRYPQLLIVPQSGTELLLEERARELGVPIHRGAEVVGLVQDDDQVRLELRGPDGPTTVTAAYVVGTDGAHSAVRRLIGVDFAGEQYATHIMLADVRLARPPGETLFGATTKEGLVLFVPFGDGWFRAIAWDRSREDVPLAEPVTFAELRGAFRRIAGDDYGMGEPRWSTRFLSERRQARRYRAGRVFLAGDAAHVHSPVGGQGMNTGIGDAMNLGWKLSATVRGWGRPGLLDTYELERHPVGEMVLRMTDGAYKLVMARTRVGLKLRQQVIRLVLRVPRARRRIAGLLSGIDIHYARPVGAHPWVGRRMPDLTGVDGERLYEALRAGRFVLVGPADQPPVAGWSDRVVAFTCAPPDELPHTLLVRPDGYVDWAADEATAAEVRAALRERCGPELTHRA
jgi:2-polyprenyl-6-methoxyphenol hydroxylase-like FAD-dependent oxidoreductase